MGGKEEFFATLGLDGPDLVRMVMVGANPADWSDGRWKERKESWFRMGKQTK